MKGMTLKKFIETITEYDEIEFSYDGVQYNFQKENAAAGKLKLSIWRSGDNVPCYSVEIENNLSALQKASQILVNAKILDGKSIAESEKYIDVEFFT